MDEKKRTDMLEKCENCKFFFAYFGEFGNCLRFPPKVFMITSSVHEHKSDFEYTNKKTCELPEVNKLSFCGEFKGKYSNE